MGVLTPENFGLFFFFLGGGGGRGGEGHAEFSRTQNDQESIVFLRPPLN